MKSDNQNLGLLYEEKLNPLQESGALRPLIDAKLKKVKDLQGQIEGLMWTLEEEMSGAKFSKFLQDLKKKDPEAFEDYNGEVITDYTEFVQGFLS